ncbi:MAG: hypothetical protein PUB21_10490 [Bacteroidales bacterium]|nr:hypothetical protein [Bacteroidales bacterium]
MENSDMEIIDEKEIEDIIKYTPRETVLAFVLAILVPGLGQLYNGQIKKALIFSLGLLTYSVGVNLLGIKAYFWTYTISLILLGILFTWSIVDAILAARRNKQYQIKTITNGTSTQS